MCQDKRKNFDENAILSFLDLNPDSSVIDLGAGDGFFSKILRKKFRDITAFDVDDSGFDDLRKDAIKTVKGNICEYAFQSYDIAFIANVFHGLSQECDGIYKILQHIVRQFLVIIDFKPSTSFGPPENMKISENKMIENFEKKGFSFIKDKDLGTHYMILFRKNDT
ncbi:MAG: class I SAM-dependent methyltransferase [Thermoplasmata archaeon]